MFLNNSLGLKITGSIWAWWTTELRMTWVTHPILNTNHPVTCYEKPQGGLMRFYLFVRCFLCECLLTFHLHTAQCRLQDVLNHVVGMQIGYQDTPGHQGYRWCLQCQGGRWKLVSQRWKVRNMWLFLGWKSCSCSCFFCSPGAYFLVQAMNHICSEQNIAPEFWKYVLHRRYVLVGEPTFWVPTSQQLCWQRNPPKNDLNLRWWTIVSPDM